MNEAQPRHQILPNWSPALHLQLYAEGYFPMANERGSIEWYTCDPRATLPLTEMDGLHIPRTIQRVLRRNRFRFKTDSAFERVIRSCAAPRSDDSLDACWLTEPIIDACLELHTLGHAHSFEAWTQDPESGTYHLAGGVYGISIGSVFFAESMFHARHQNPALDGTNASSAALIALTNHLAACGFTLLDIQYPNAHTEGFGVLSMPRDAFESRLIEAVHQPQYWQPLETPETLDS